MNLLDTILEPVGKALIFERLRPGLRAYFSKAGYAEVPYVFFGQLFYFMLAIFLGIYIWFVLPLFEAENLVVAFASYFFSAVTILVLLAIVAISFIHFFLGIKIANRTKQLEEILPDYLMLVSTNLKGGMSFEKALWDAIKPEFGILANEIGLVSKKVMTGNDVVDALDGFVQKYDSPILRRNFQLMVSEFESGGEIVVVIDKIIANLKKTQLLKKEMVASTVTYMIFIAALVMVICPGLFALSYQLFFIIQGFMQSLSGTGATAGALQIASAEINSGDFRLFSILAIVIISLGSACITSIIEKGDMSGIVKYAPMYVITSLIVYFLCAAALGSVFASLTFT